MILKIENISINKLMPYENNARKHTEEDVQTIINSIQEFGFNDPVGVWGENNIIVEGHGRFLAAKKLGIKEIPCIRLDELSDEQRKAYTLAHNKTAEMSTWDFEKLEIELESISGIDMSDFGFDIDLDEEQPTDIVEDEAPEEVETKAKLGDLWILGNNRLICGDSTDVAVIDRLMDGVKADMVFTDPPYSIGNAGGGIVGKSNSMKQIKQNGVDSFDPSRLTMWCETNIFCHNKPLIKAYIELAENNNLPYDLAFYKKKNTVPNYKGHLMTDVEYIAIIGKQDPNKGLEKGMYSKCFIGQKDNDNELSYSKPVALCAKYIQLYSKQSVLDLFGGSGSTLIACEQLNRRCYMCELDPKYVSVILQRYINFKGSDEDVFLLKDGRKIPYSKVKS